ncbi:MAG TPA: hypothetical protein VLD37_07635 [Candidatus Bilamarchaeum sp.]|nr:hypothetical protein [Candidatus Bilamarchaeum sp.]
MKDDISGIMEMISSRSIMDRKAAIRQLKARIRSQSMARLILHYVSEHDPSYTVRNVARQAFYAAGEPPEQAVWEKHYLFRSE